MDPHERFPERRFSTAALADDAENVTMVDVEAHVVERFQPSDLDAERIADRKVPS